MTYSCLLGLLLLGTCSGQQCDHPAVISQLEKEAELKNLEIISLQEEVQELRKELENQRRLQEEQSFPAGFRPLSPVASFEDSDRGTKSSSPKVSFLSTPLIQIEQQ